MRLYSLKHLGRIDLYTWAYQNLKIVHQSPPYSANASEYVLPTDEAEQLIQKHNVVAALKGIKPCRPVYKGVYTDKQGNMRWTN
jgi:hypothetical protein